MEVNSSYLFSASSIVSFCKYWHADLWDNIQVIYSMNHLMIDADVIPCSSQFQSKNKQ